MRALFRYTLVGLVLLTIMLVSALTAMRFAIHGREIAVPKLIGMTPVEAERIALNNGLLVEVENRFYSGDIPEGKIVSQVPQPGVRVRRGWRVRVAESLGPQRVVIPNVVGQSARAAELNLQQRGLEVGTVAVAHLPDSPPDQIVAQSPPPNASGVSSPKINLLISAPGEEQRFVMPDFIGRPLAEAAKIVQDAGFKLGTVKQVGSAVKSPVPNGVAASPARGSATVVVRQTPTAGERVVAGTTISFEVAP